MKTDIKNADWMDYVAMAMLPAGIIVIAIMAVADLIYRVIFRRLA